MDGVFVDEWNAMSIVRLVPMTESAFEGFMGISVRDQAQGQIRAGNIRPEDAREHIERQRTCLLPNGLSTQDHFFFVIEE